MKYTYMERFSISISSHNSHEQFHHPLSIIFCKNPHYTRRSTLRNKAVVAIYSYERQSLGGSSHSHSRGKFHVRTSADDETGKGQFFNRHHQHHHHQHPTVYCKCIFFIPYYIASNYSISSSRSVK
jgi:hypothetical protein